MKHFITFEGIDGSGKSTIAQQVHDHLKQENIPIVLTYEPTDSDIGRFVQHCIKTQADPYVTAFSFIADRIQHCTQIQRWIKKGNLVLCDRYAESTYAYQGAQLESELQHPMRWLQDLSQQHILIPEKTFFFKIVPRLALQRISNRKDLIPFEQLVFLEKVHKNYLQLCKGPRFITIDASEPIERVVRNCVYHLKKLL